jgi:hypothetical protein
MANELKPLDTPEFHRLDGCLDGMSGLIGEGQLDWYFDVKGFELNDADISVTTIIKTAYSGSRPDKATISECSSREMLDELNRQISVERPMWGDPNKTARVPLLRDDAAFWRLLKACIDYEQARIFEYIPSYDVNVQDELRSGITKEFTFAIVNHAQQRCVIFSGANCD